MASFKLVIIGTHQRLGLDYHGRDANVIAVLTRSCAHTPRAPHHHRIEWEIRRGTRPARVRWSRRSLPRSQGQMELHPRKTIPICSIGARSAGGGPGESERAGVTIWRVSDISISRARDVRL
jgi:hypothetical protein